MRVTIALVMVFGTFFSIAQTQNSARIDSLRSSLSTAKGIDRFNSNYEIVFEYFGQGLVEKALPFIEEAQNVALQIGDSLRIVKAGRVYGQLLNRQGRTSEAIAHFVAVIPIAKRNNFTDEYLTILNSLAVSYSYQANYDKALQTHFESLTLREKEDDKEGIAITLNNIGFVYYKLQNLEKALEYFKKALSLTTNPKFKAQWLINVGLCFNGLKDYTNAKKSIEEGYLACGPDCDDFVTLQGEYGLGSSAFGLLKPSEATKHFQKSYALSKKLHDTRLQIENLIYLARIDASRHNIDSAMTFLKEAERFAEQTKYNQLLINIYRDLSVLLTEKKQFENASSYQTKYIKLKDSIYSEDLIKNLAHIQANYDERENLKTIKDQDASLALKEETLKRQKAENVFYAVAGIMVFILAGLMLLLFRLSRRANERLEERVDVRTRELNDTNDALMKVNGEMDNFIYKTSHDIRGPLASLKGICNVAIMDVQDTTALGYLKKLDSTADKLNMILTRLLIINQINHAVLAPNIINFEEIIEEILLLEHKKGIPKRLNISYQVEKGLGMKSDKEMLRIVLENLIDNGIKFHNESVRVEPFVNIRVTSANGQVTIIVADNGVGINDETKEKIFQMFVRASERSETGGIGLYLSKLATERLSGNIDFRSAEEKTTEFVVTLPLDLGPILDRRREQEKAREYERIRPEKKTISTT